MKFGAATWKDSIRALKVGQTGYYYVLNAEDGPQRGQLVVHPALEGQNMSDSKDGDGIIQHSYLHKQLVTSGKFDAGDATANIIEQIKELIETRVRPAVAQDGGDIAYHGYRDGRLYLSMHGACSGCPSSTVTLKRGIEGLIRHYVPEVESVEAV